MSADWADGVASAPNVSAARIATKATSLLSRSVIMINEVVPSLGAGDLSTSAWNDFSAKMRSVVCGASGDLFIYAKNLVLSTKSALACPAHLSGIAPAAVKLGKEALPTLSR